MSVENAKNAIGAIKRRGMSAVRNNSCAIGTSTEEATNKLTPPSVTRAEPSTAERAGGKAVWDAVIEAATSRFRPIMLTAISTVVGTIPIAPTIFRGPMAYAIMGGLLVATVVTLIFLPAL
jgi:hypothetical protein